jgi:hypothetical protein
MASESRSRRRSWVIHPLSFALFPVLSLYSSNIHETPADQVVLPLVVAAAITLFIQVAARLLLKNGDRVGIVLSAAVLIFFLYGHMLRVVEAVRLPGPAVALAVTTTLFFLAVVWLTARTGRDLGAVTKLLNVLSLSLLVVVLVPILLHAVQTIGERDYSRLPALDPGVPAASIGAGPNPPDVYYLVFDRFGSEGSIKEFCGLDTAPFFVALRERGFHVIEHARPNYPKTSHSLASSMNMEYLTFLEEAGITPATDYGPLHQMMRGDYRVARFLRGQGYHYYHVGSWYSPTASNRYAERNFRFQKLSEFASILYESTVLYSLVDLVTHVDDRMMQYQSIGYVFERLAAMPAERGPRFVFAHVLLPHTPYVIDADGSFLPRSVRDERSDEVNYANQVRFASSAILDLVDTLIRDSATPPIIILQADEGPHPIRYVETEAGKHIEHPFSWRNITDAEVRIKFGILGAIYLPGTDAGQDLTPERTSVNTFRIVFNHVFGTRFPLLPDACYTPLDSRHLYEFIDVTARTVTDGPGMAGAPDVAAAAAE